MNDNTWCYLYISSQQGKSDCFARDGKSHCKKNTKHKTQLLILTLAKNQHEKCERNLVLSGTQQIGFFVSDAPSSSISDIKCLPNHHCMKHLFSARLAQPYRNVPCPKEIKRW